MRVFLTIILLFLISACNVQIGTEFKAIEVGRNNMSPENASPDVYKVLHETDDFIILEVIFEPGQGDNLHTHSDMFYYVVEGGQMQVTNEEGEVFTAELKSGDFQIQGSTTHQVTNIGTTRARIIAVEEK